ncbi:MAG: carboxypeptidase-like regulatory domain-containing protein, partial [Bacteroidales bacterium]|nr:carboxypeptidase-like regulatory domain-containing protein [Candidatus Cryptobacteroides faecihippi]
MKKTITFLALLLFVFCGSLRGQTRTDSLVVVRGKVLHAKEGIKGTIPLNGATVTLVNGRDTLYAITNLDGEFTFAKVRPTPSFLSVSCVGFKTEEGEYDIVRGTNLCYFTLYEK